MDDDLTSAVCMIDRIMEEQKAREIKQLAEQKAQLSLEQYEQKMVAEMADKIQQEGFAEENTIVRDIIDEAELETEEKELDSMEALNFAEYVQQKRAEAEKKATARVTQLQLESFLRKKKGENGNGSEEDIDEVTLKLMQGLSKESAEKLDMEMQEPLRSIT
mmetsp:Transcript_55672/g.82831  ORF Transcript_55672/g.82831 Transcript_55672/m.82831 type:complete len:162 (+) Transcript_55672:1024-1509(+)